MEKQKDEQRNEWKAAPLNAVQWKKYRDANGMIFWVLSPQQRGGLSVKAPEKFFSLLFCVFVPEPFVSVFVFMSLHMTSAGTPED